MYNTRCGYIYTICIDKNSKVLWENTIYKSQDVNTYGEILISFASMKDSKGNIHIFFVHGINDLTLLSSKAEFIKTMGITHKVINREGDIEDGKYIPRDKNIKEFPPLFVAKNTSNIDKDEYILVEWSRKNTQRMIKLKLTEE